jgi:hypothetical protein
MKIAPPLKQVLDLMQALPELRTPNCFGVEKTPQISYILLLKF